jgi:SAM-dependent methyltransferase
MNPNAAGTDDWNTHWNHYASAASENPAQNFRHRLIIRLLCGREAGSGMRVLDIGSGQGDLIKKLSARLSGGRFLGIDLSKSGVEISRRKVPGAEFFSADLLEPPEALARYHSWATHAACSEVLEHLDDPICFLRQARKFLHADAKVVFTVPGGRMSAFDRHIGHRRHFNRSELRALLEQSGFSVERICLAGFPFFNLYRLVVIARGERLVDDVKENNTGWSKRLSIIAMRVFDWLFHLNLLDSPFGWQLVAVAKNREEVAK